MAGIDDQDRHGHPNFGIKPDPLPLDRLLDVPPGQPISRILIDQNAIPTKDMVFALGEADRLGAPLEHVLRSEGLADRDDILLAHATHLGALLLRRDISPPDPNCAALLSPEFCLTHSVLPWRFDGKHIILATAHPENFDKVCAFLPEEIGPVRMALCSEEDIHADIAARHGAYLTRQAETVAPADTSCRDIGTGSVNNRIVAVAAGLAVCTALALFPNYVFVIGLVLALCSLTVLQALRLSAWIASIRAPVVTPDRLAPIELPDITLIIALFREESIAESLLQRLAQLDYPRSRLQVLLALEEDDMQTQALLDKTALPFWIRRIAVPTGSIKTKPRALNYALRFARGDIIGIYDAEDAPARNQLQKVAAQFATSPPHVACLQGILDFYNTKSNWLARCFAIEYATWFRVILPGLARMGLAVPLGGTTVFFRRSALETVGCWDAHNVTEDADLGIRLARSGYRTDMLRSVTREEATNRIWPWVKQRSRWLKGYAITWWVHTRHPVRLMQDLGPKKFWGFQALFLATLVQFFLAPVLWTFWLMVFGLNHPVHAVLPSQILFWVMGLMICSEAASLIVYYAGIARSTHKGLTFYALTLFAYFPLGTFALYKALIEVVRNPFYWDKTQHGLSVPDTTFVDPQTDPDQPTS